MYILIIYVVLILVVAPLWLMVDTNLKSMLLLEKGRAANAVSQRINDTLSIMNASMWYLDEWGDMEFNDGFYEKYKVRQKTVNREIWQGWLAPESRRLLENLHFSDGHETISNQEIQLRLPDSEQWHTFTLDAFDAPSSMKHVRRVGMISLIDDIKKEENERAEAYRIEENANTTKEIIISMSDGIRTPLKSVLANCAVLFGQFDSLSPDRRKEYGSQILKDADRMLAMIGVSEE